MKINVKVPPLLTRHIIVDSFGHVVHVYILNQFRGHWLLNDALNYAISLSLKFKVENDYIIFNNLMEENGNVVYELYVWPPTLKKSYSW